jgi:hypothetical protein
MVASDDPARGRQSSTHDLSDRQAISIKGKVGHRTPNARIDRNSFANLEIPGRTRSIFDNQPKLRIVPL